MHRNLRKLILHLAIFLLISAAFSTSTFAITVSQYREKVSRVYDTLDYLSYPEEDLSDAENLAAQRVKIQEIRSILPQTDRIELQNGTFEVDNKWLYEKLAEAEREPLNSPNRRKIIDEISDKLAALEAKLLEFENQASAKRSKDEDKRKLGEILNRPEYQKPEEKKESFIQKAINDLFEWLKNVFPKFDLGESSGINTQPIKPFLQFVVFLVAFGIIGFLLYRFAPVLFKSFRQREKKNKETRVILGETLSADETSQNLFSEAEDLAGKGDLRAAIRKGYIAFLCELSDRKIIGLASHKTNRDYLRDVYKRENLYQEMRGLTSNFERYWYGFEAARNEDWEIFKKQYKEAINKSN